MSNLRIAKGYVADEYVVYDAYRGYEYFSGTYDECLQYVATH